MTLRDPNCWANFTALDQMNVPTWKMQLGFFEEFESMHGGSSFEGRHE